MGRCIRRGRPVTSARRAARPHALWTTPLEHESDAPAQRAIHLLRSPIHPGPARVGFRSALGYLKCGSREETDWVRDARIWAWRDEGWRQLESVRDLPRPGGNEVSWIDLDAAGATALAIELRRSWIDDWWPGWNLADRGIMVEAATAHDDLPAPQRGVLEAVQVSLEGLPDGMRAQRLGGTVRFESDVLRVTFRLHAPALAELDFDPDGLRAPGPDLIKRAAAFDHTGVDLINNVHLPLRGAFANGPRFGSLDGVEPVGFLTAGYEGDSRVDGANVRYRVYIPSVGLAYAIDWRVEPDSLSVAVERRGDRDLAAAESCAWQIPFASEATPLAAVAAPRRSGETGLVSERGLLHAPGRGSLRFETQGDLQIRLDSARPLMVVDLELKVGERPGDLATWELPAGRWSGAARFEVSHGITPILGGDVPPEARDAITRTALSGLAFRADTATLSNNGNSIHATFCMDHWAALAIAVDRLDPSLRSADLVIESILRHLDGAPGYGAGATSAHGDRMEGEYLQTDPAVLHAIGSLLEAGLGEQLIARGPDIGRLLEEVRTRDLDGDGLIESRIRVGTPGDDVWGTNWWDLIGFGWKDAWVNALLYGAIRQLVRSAAMLGLDGDALGTWADQLRAAYRASFWDPARGWVAGWQDRDGVVHDFAFLYVNGTAISEGLLDAHEARGVAERLLDLLKHEGPPDLRAGLPGHLRPIPDELMASPFPAMGFGFYENGAQTLSQARHFIGALYHVGLVTEADRLLLPMLGALADGSAFGGCASGLDWRSWDGTPCGYEGILTDQFGVLVPAIERWGA